MKEHILLVPSGEILEICYDTLRKLKHKVYSPKYGIHKMDDSMKGFILDLDKICRGKVSENIKTFEEWDSSSDIDWGFDEEEDRDNILNNDIVLSSDETLGLESGTYEILRRYYIDDEWVYLVRNKDTGDEYNLSKDYLYGKSYWSGSGVINKD